MAKLSKNDLAYIIAVGGLRFAFNRLKEGA